MGVKTVQVWPIRMFHPRWRRWLGAPPTNLSVGRAEPWFGAYDEATRCHVRPMRSDDVSN